MKIILACFTLTGCTVFSGWSDLQGGKSTGKTPPSSTSTSAASDDGGAPGANGQPGFACGNEACGGGQICCYTFTSGSTGARACTSTAAGCDGLPLHCQRREDCASGVCCLGPGNGGSTCQASCSAGSSEMCMTGDPTGCTAAGATCQPDYPGSDMFICQ